MYSPKHFKAYELVDEETYKKFGEGAIQLFNPLALRALDAVREHFDRAVIVNNWKTPGGKFQWRGLRTFNCLEGARWSQHRLGAAFDCDVDGLTADQVRNSFLANRNKGDLSLITCIEAGVNWFHFDVRNIDVSNGVKVVYQ